MNAINLCLTGRGDGRHTPSGCVRKSSEMLANF